MAGKRGVKKCSVCKKMKPRSAFNRRARSADGYRSECKTCQAKRRKKDYKEKGK